MATTKQEIEEWFDHGVNQGATHMIVVCDTFDHEDYPVYVGQGDSVQEQIEHYRKESMQRVMEVYNLSKDKGGQLSVYRCWEI